MPKSAAKALDLLGVDEACRTFEYVGPAGRLQSGSPLKEPSPLFPRYIES